MHSFDDIHIWSKDCQQKWSRFIALVFSRSWNAQYSLHLDHQIKSGKTSKKGPVSLHLGWNEIKQVQRRVAFLITPVHAHRLLDHHENPGSRADFHPNMWKPQTVLTILAQIVNKQCSKKDFSIFAQLSNVSLARRRLDGNRPPMIWRGQNHEWFEVQRSHKTETSCGWSPDFTARNLQRTWRRIPCMLPCIMDDRFHKLLSKLCPKLSSNDAAALTSKAPTNQPAPWRHKAIPQLSKLRGSFLTLTGHSTWQNWGEGR